MVELCAFKRHLSILYFLLSVHDDEGKLAIWRRLVEMARRRVDIDATVAFRTLKMMTKPPPPPPPPEPGDESQDGPDQGALFSSAAPVPVVTVNPSWKRVHACEFEKTVKSRLAGNICDKAKVTEPH